MDQAFLRQCQAAGWQIESVNGASCVGRCPEPGCGVRANLDSRQPVPPRSSPPIPDHVVRSVQETTDYLRNRRIDLGLTTAEVEHVAGVASHIVAKAESTLIRGRGLDTVIPWAQALGYELVLRPAPMPPLMLRTLAESREQAAKRQRSAAYATRRKTA